MTAIRAWKECCLEFARKVNRRYTIKQKILVSFLLVVVSMMALNLFVVYRLYSYSRQYDLIIQRTSSANRLVELNDDIIFEAWPLSIGNLELKDSRMMEYFSEMEKTLGYLENVTQQEDSLESLKRARRSKRILKSHGSNLLDYVKADETSDLLQKSVDAIRDVGSLMKEYLNEYIFRELNHADMINQQISANVKEILFANMIALLFIGILILSAIYVINNSISTPIKTLVKTTKQVGSGDFNVRVDTRGNKDEIAILNDNFNQMVARLQMLMDDVRISSENLKKAELQLLQEQINPHFLYNTLETIIWMAEKQDNEQVITLVQELSVFFHTTLSGGKDIIFIEDEIRHIESYLSIQHFRYQDIMQYKIDIPDELRRYRIPKLSLQPVIENALYHGIKSKRGQGHIIIQGRSVDEDTIEICITDTGIGMKEKDLLQLRKTVEQASFQEEQKDGGYGLPNVQKRLQLYCGEDYGIHIKSIYGKGTTVTLKISKHL